MPFFADSDLDSSVDLPTGTTAPDDVLARVKSEGLRRRSRRHRRNSALAVLGIAIAAVPAVALLPDGGGDAEDVTVAAESDRRPATSVERRDVDPGPSTTAAPTETLPPTTVVEVDGGEAVLIPPTSVVRPPRPTPTTVPPTTVPTCRNSFDAACGEFRWDPDPGPNAPLNVAFLNASEPIPAGDYTFEVSWADDDAALAYSDFALDGDPLLGQACTQEARFGPWTPPARAGGSGVISETFTLTPGEHVIAVAAGTGDCNNPYASEATVEVVVTVQ